MANPAAGPHRPAAPPVPCAQCQTAVDPIRAPYVSATDDGFHFFCSVVCQQSFLGSLQAAPERPKSDPVRRREPSFASEPIAERADSQHELRRALYEVSNPAEGDFVLRKPEGPSGRAGPEPNRASAAAFTTSKPTPELDSSTLLSVVAALGSLLSLALALAGETGAALVARVVLVAVADSLLIFEMVTAQRNELSLPAIIRAAPSVSCVAIAATACAFDRGEAAGLTTAAALLVIATAIDALLLRRCRASVEFERSGLKQTLDADAQRFHDGTVTVIPGRDLRPGEEVVVGPGETVLADGTVVAGQAVVVPWHQSSEQFTLSEGACVVAGAKVLEGRIRVVVAWSGLDRAWLRLTADPRRRADLQGLWAKAGRLIGLRIAPVIGGLTALTVYAAGLSIFEILTVAICSFAVFTFGGISELPALHVGRATFAALRRGIAFRSADALERAGRVSTATFCARGTLLLGEPEVTSVESFGTANAERVLELAAGAQGVSADPSATSILRAARARNLRPDAVRSPAYLAGLGVTAVASDGQRLIVGSRALMLKEYVSIALAEGKISELEATGRSVLLIALGSRIIGAIGLQDGMRPGARAAVQHLLDVNIEPVLLSGDTRETCEALGQALDIDHVRPEVLPSDRSEEIRRLIDGGAVVAVIGRSPVDDAALAAADLAIALNCAGGAATDWHVQLASDDVRDAAFALRVGHHLRKELWYCLLLCVGSAAAGAACIAFALLPIGAAPVLALMGVAASAYRWHTAV